MMGDEKSTVICGTLTMALNSLHMFSSSSVDA